MRIRRAGNRHVVQDGVPISQFGEGDVLGSGEPAAAPLLRLPFPELPDTGEALGWFEPTGNGDALRFVHEIEVRGRSVRRIGRLLQTRSGNGHHQPACWDRELVRLVHFLDADRSAVGRACIRRLRIRPGGVRECLDRLLLLGRARIAMQHGEDGHQRTGEERALRHVLVLARAGRGRLVGDGEVVPDGFLSPQLDDLRLLLHGPPHRLGRTVSHRFLDRVRGDLRLADRIDPHRRDLDGERIPGGGAKPDRHRRRVLKRVDRDPPFLRDVQQQASMTGHGKPLRVPGLLGASRNARKADGERDQTC